MRAMSRDMGLACKLLLWRYENIKIHDKILLKCGLIYLI